MQFSPRTLPALLLAPLLLLFAACEAENANNNDTPTPGNATHTPTPVNDNDDAVANNTNANQQNNDVAPCLAGEGFVEQGDMGAFGDDTGDARQVHDFRWGIHTDGCERFVIDLAGADGNAAEQTGPVHAEFLRERGVVRVHLDDTFERVTYEDLSEVGIGAEFMDSAFTVIALDGHQFVDIHVASPALARAFVLDSPARVVVDFQPGGGEVPPPPATASNIVVLEPRTESQTYPLELTGYARTFESNVLARLRANDEVEAETNTTAAAWAETWGEFRLTLDEGPAGAVELFAGELSARDGSEEGVRIDLTMQEAAVAPCLAGEGFVHDGSMGGTGEPGDARQVEALRWAEHPGCERFVIDFVDADGNAADQTGPVDAEYLRHLGVIRVYLSNEFDLGPTDAATDIHPDDGLIDSGYTVWSLGGYPWVDIHLADPVLARILILESPARVVVDVQPGGDELAAQPVVEDNVVLLEPNPGPAEYPLTIRGYSRVHEADMLARLRTNTDIEAEERTVAAAWVDTWGEYEMTIEQGPEGGVELFVGGLSAVDGSEEGARINLNIADEPDDATVLPCHDPLVPVDKERSLPADCVPPDLVQIDPTYAIDEQYLREEAADALHSMLIAAAQEGHHILARSAYRSYETQEETFNFWVEQLGLEEAERVSARPGHSEHQLGTAVDLTSAAVDFELDQAFADTPAGEWLARNAWQYGFVLSYPEDQEELTGFIFEPWHYRYVGVDHAQAINEADRVPGRYLLERWTEASNPSTLIRHGPRGTNQVALTLDMNGQEGTAQGIMQWLAANRIPATIFVTGNLAENTQFGREVVSIVNANPDLFEFGNHSYWHPDLTLRTAAQVRNELITTENAVAWQSNLPVPPYFRPPYGSWNQTVLNIAGQVGYPYTVLWDVDPQDWRPGMTAAQISQTVVNNAFGGSIVLLHLHAAPTLDALPAIVDGLRARGLEPVRLSDMFP